MKILLRVVLCLVLLCFHKTIHGSVISIEDRGYKGILVAVQNSVPEDVTLIDNLKVLLTNASKFLFESTNGSVYFKEITIAIPPTWSPSQEYDVLPGSFFSVADVRIDHPNPEYGDTPYTLQPGGCGEPGQYIHLTPWFVKELKGATMDMFGTPERQFVHEWAHLRYGVFDEYGIPGDRRFPMFYFENGKIRPTSCIRDIRGWIESRDGGPCSIMPGGQVDNDCIFVPDMQSKDAKASIMYMPFIPSMEGFCDGGEHRKHNIKAPTKHNTMCNYESTWSVISRHQDFVKSRVTREVPTSTDPVFRLVQPPRDQKGRYVLALDVSGSMNGRPIKLLHRAATRLVEDRIPDGAYLGIVQFSTNAEILQGLTKVDSTTREKLSKSLPDTDDGGRTAIGKGIQEAINVLKEGNVSPEAGLIILITDGEENVTPFVHDVIPEILKEKVIINAVAFGSEASSKLENVTMITGGKGYFFSNINGSRPASALDSAFLESITSQSDLDLQPVQLKDEMIGLYETSTVRKVRIDQELGRNTIFIITSPYIERVDITLESPSGRIYDSSSAEYSRDNNPRQRIQVLLGEAEPGKWKVSLNRIGDHAIIIALSVTSEPKDIKKQPIRVRSWLNDMQLKYPAYAKVYAEVKKGYRAVVKATVIATVDRPMGGAVDIPLRDDGVGADVTKNDGIYTGYFTHFNGNGRYAVIARVVNDGQAKLKNGTRASGSPPVPRMKGSTSSDPMNEFPINEFVPSKKNYSATDEDNVIAEPASEFDRSTDAGAFRLEEWVENVGDIIPPSSIMDLEVLSVENLENTTEITLQWTAPGDDLDEGNVSSIQLRASQEMESLVYGFQDGILLNESMIIDGSLSSEEGGTLQYVKVSLPQYLYNPTTATMNSTVYFAAKGKDDAENLSPQHNIAAAHVLVKRRIMEITQQEAEQKQKENEQSQKQRIQQQHEEDIKNGKIIIKENNGSTFKWWPTALGIGVVVGLILLSLALVIVIMQRRKKKSYSSVANGQELVS